MANSLCSHQLLLMAVAMESSFNGILNYSNAVMMIFKLPISIKYLIYLILSQTLHQPMIVMTLTAIEINAICNSLCMQHETWDNPTT